ncbi:MAG: hypothetical protein MJE77_01970 [Proteobacteria bacterium]|nr:hypothetical protein [Pseudomonadota bacterium]
MARSTETLGWRGRAEIVDLIERVCNESAGIHLVLTDRPGPVQKAIHRRLPAQCRVLPLANSRRDGLHIAVQSASVRSMRVFMDAFDPREATEHELVRALNIEREWLMTPSNHAVIVITGKTLADADDAYLALQAKAPDLWSLRSHVYRIGDPDDDLDTRDHVEARVADLVEAGRGDARIAAIALQALNATSWEQYRLWRGPRYIAAWLADVAAEQPNRAVTEVADELADQLADEPMGPPLRADLWPAPEWPSGHVDDEERLLVDGLVQRLHNGRDAQVYVLAEDGDAARMRRVILNVALLHEARFDGVVEFDGEVEDWLRRAGLADSTASSASERVSSPMDGLRRLSGALSGSRALVVMTGVTDNTVALARMVLRDHVVVAAVLPRKWVPFAICHHVDRGDWARSYHALLESMGATGIVVPWTGADLSLALRQSLACARAVLVIASPVRSPAQAWLCADRARDRIAGVVPAGDPIPVGAEALTWLRVRADEAADRIAVQARFRELVDRLLGPGRDRRLDYLAPEPRYQDQQIRRLGQSLECAYAHKAALQKAGASTDKVAEEILQLKRDIRQGGRL